MSNLKEGYASGSIEYCNVEQEDIFDKKYFMLKGRVIVTHSNKVDIEPEKVWLQIQLSTHVAVTDDLKYTGFWPKEADLDAPEVQDWLERAKCCPDGVFTKNAYDICAMAGIDLDTTPDWMDRLAEAQFPSRLTLKLKYKQPKGSYKGGWTCNAVYNPLGRKEKTLEQLQDRNEACKRIMATMRRLPKIGIPMKQGGNDEPTF